jgi:hypothetical protein
MLRFFSESEYHHGKALDLLVDNLKLIFPENTVRPAHNSNGNKKLTTRDQPLELSAAPFNGGEVTTLRNDKPLSEQVEDGPTLTIQTRQPKDS